MTDSCANCRFAKPIPQAEKPTVMCRRIPPQLHVTGACHFPALSDPTTHWCGEHQREPNVARKRIQRRGR